MSTSAHDFPSARRRVPRLGLLVAALAAGIVISRPSPADAGEPSANELARARRAFSDGVALSGQGQWERAAEKFRAAAAIKDTPGIRFHLARCEEERGAPIEALREYDRAHELIAHGVAATDVERLLGPARERARAKVARVMLQVEGGPAAATFELDGKSLARSVIEWPLQLNPGPHRLRAKAKQGGEFNADFALANGEARTLYVTFPAPKAEPPPAPPKAAPRKPEEPGASSAKAIVIGSEIGLIVAGLGAGIAFTFVRSAADDRYDQANRRIVSEVGTTEASRSACTPPEAAPSCGDLAEAKDSRERAAVWATTGYVTAAAATAALGLTWWLWPSEQQPARVAFSAIPWGHHGATINLSTAW